MTSVADRVNLMLDELGVDQPALGKLAGASKAMVNHWLSGKVKSISAEFAYNLEAKTPFSAQWIQTGRGSPKKHSADLFVMRYNAADPATRTLIDLALADPGGAMPEGISPSLRVLVDMARTAIRNEQQREDGKPIRDNPGT